MNSNSEEAGVRPCWFVGAMFGPDDQTPRFLQEGVGDPLADKASGLLLHPSLGTPVNEIVLIQNHEIQFATVDLTASARDIRKQLLEIVGASHAN